MRAPIRCDRMGVRRVKSLAYLFQTPAALIKDCDDAALGGDINSPQRLIQGQHVRVATDLLDGRNLPALKIEDGKARVRFAGNEGKAPLTVY